MEDMDTQTQTYTHKMGGGNSRTYRKMLRKILKNKITKKTNYNTEKLALTQVQDIHKIQKKKNTLNTQEPLHHA